MTKGRVLAAAAAFLAAMVFVQTAAAQYPTPIGSLECTTEVSVQIDGKTSVTATLRDTAGGPVEGVTVHFSVVSGDASLSAASAVTDGQGRATASLLAGSSAGNVTVAAGTDELECRAVTQVLGASFSPPSTGDAGLRGGEIDGATALKLAALIGLGSLAGYFWSRQLIPGNRRND